MPWARPCPFLANTRCRQSFRHLQSSCMKVLDGSAKQTLDFAKRAVSSPRDIKSTLHWCVTLILLVWLDCCFATNGRAAGIRDLELRLSSA